jgi:tetratricopeptide (TPR) repeat protein
MKTAHLLLAIVTLCLSVSDAAGAAPRRTPKVTKPVPEARSSFERGVKEYNLGHFEAAAAEFEKAYQLDPVPIFLFNMAQSFRQLGNVERALFFYRRYLESPDIPDRADVERRIAELETRREAEKKQAELAPPPAALTAPAPPPPSPPKADTTTVALSQHAVPAPTEDKPVWRRWWFWAGAAALVGGAAVTGILLSGGGGAAAPKCAPGERCTEF